MSEFALSGEAFTETRTLALIVDDPDAPIGTFTHWLAWNIDPSAGGLAEGASPPAEGTNDFGALEWNRPCPPQGHGPHRYFFASTPSTPSSSSDQPRVATRSSAHSRGHVLATAVLIGRYER